MESIGDKLTPALLATLISHSETPVEMEYETCYSASLFSKVAGGSFLKNDGVFIQWYGGGPEGGVLICADGNYYLVNREWSQPFTMEKIDGNPRFVVNSENPDLMRMLKDGEEPTEEEMEFEVETWHEKTWEEAKLNYEEAMLSECADAETPTSSEESEESEAKFSKDELEILRNYRYPHLPHGFTPNGPRGLSFDDVGMPVIADLAFQRDVKEFEKLEEQIEAVRKVYVYLQDLQDHQRIQLTTRAKEFWAADEATEAAKFKADK